MKQVHKNLSSTAERARETYPRLRNESSLVRQIECWQQDPDAPDLWHGEAGVIVNTAALEQRTFYFEVVRVYTAGNRSLHATSLGQVAEARDHQSKKTKAAAEPFYAPAKRQKRSVKKVT